MTPLRIIYFGTADFAVAPLGALLADPARFDVVGVVSRPDKPVGRRAEMQAAPVAALARERGLRLLQPTKLKDDEFFSALSALRPDVLVVASYGRIIPPRILTMTRVAPLNLHGSLLPKYRGASPIQAAILEGETVTGVSLMVMDEEIDHGPVVATAEVPISLADTHESLEHTLGDAAAALLVSHVERFAAGALQAVPQDHSRATHTRILTREDGAIDWQAEDAARIERKTRAYFPWPGAYFVWQRGASAGTASGGAVSVGMISGATSGTHPAAGVAAGALGVPLRIKLLKARAIDLPPDAMPGTHFTDIDGTPAVAARGGAVALVQVQPEGKKAVDGKAFLHGYKDWEKSA